MKKILALLLALGTISAFAACGSEDLQSPPPISSSSSSSSSQQEEVPETPLTKAEWEALLNPELYKNVTATTTQIDSYFKTVATQLITEDYCYIKYTTYDLKTDKPNNTQGWNKVETAKMNTLPHFESYGEIAYDNEKGVYYSVEDTVLSLGGSEWTYTTMEWKVTDGKLVEYYGEFWYMDEVNGEQKKITGTTRTVYSMYGTTVAPEA